MPVAKHEHVFKPTNSKSVRTEDGTRVQQSDRQFMREMGIRVGK